MGIEATSIQGRSEGAIYLDVVQVAGAILVDVEQGETIVTPAHVDAGTVAKGYGNELVRLLQRQDVDAAVVGEGQNISIGQTANAWIVQLDLVIVDVRVQVNHVDEIHAQGNESKRSIGQITEWH